MPVDYSLGKVYKIVGNGKIYVGSTCERLLCQRLAGHKRVYNCWLNGKGSNVTSYECVGDPDCYIELLELCPCSCVDELRKCEGKWIRDLECVNRCVAGRTPSEYYESHKEEINEKMKAYNAAHKETIVEYQKAYKEATREKIAEYQKAYRLKKKAEQQSI
jgi:hypothetical protein